MTHFGHSNIVKACSKWDDKWGCRSFNSLEQMNQTIIYNFNKIVKENDILYHLGDWSFGGIQNIWNFRKQLNCKNIHLILGNHDEHIKNGRGLPNVSYEEINNIFIDSDSKYSDLEFEVNAKELFSSTQDTLTVTHNKYTFFMSHYSHRVWYGSHKGIIHLYGHSHSTLEYESWGKSMDVGIDNARKLLDDYRPFNISEIINIMNKRDIKFVDGHNKDTNIK